MFLEPQPLPGTYELCFAGMNWGFDGINQGVKILKKFLKNLQKRSIVPGSQVLVQRSLFKIAAHHILNFEPGTMNY
jgi:hypothetical protein